MTGASQSRHPLLDIFQHWHLLSDHLTDHIHPTLWLSYFPRRDKAQETAALSEDVVLLMPCAISSASDDVVAFRVLLPSRDFCLLPVDRTVFLRLHLPTLSVFVYYLLALAELY